MHMIAARYMPNQQHTSATATVVRTTQQQCSVVYCRTFDDVAYAETVSYDGPEAEQSQRRVSTITVGKRDRRGGGGGGGRRLSETCALLYICTYVVRLSYPYDSVVTINKSAVRVCAIWSARIYPGDNIYTFVECKYYRTSWTE